MVPSAGVILVNLADLTLTLNAAAEHSLPKILTHTVSHILVKFPIRLAYINELNDSKLDADFLKEFVDGAQQA